jgi:hypothetical protein
VPDNSRVKGGSADGVAADYEFLGAVHSHLHPGTRTLPRFVSAVARLATSPSRPCALMDWIRSDKLASSAAEHTTSRRPPAIFRSARRDRLDEPGPYPSKVLLAVGDPFRFPLTAQAILREGATASRNIPHGYAS